MKMIMIMYFTRSIYRRIIMENMKNTKEQNYARDDRRVRRCIERFIKGERKNPLICTKSNMVEVYEQDYGVLLEYRSPVKPESNLFMYEIIA